MVVHHSSFFDSVHGALIPIPRRTTSAEAQSTQGGKILRLSNEITVYLGNGRDKAYGYYGMLIVMADQFASV